MTSLRSVRVLVGVSAVSIAALLVGGASAALGVCGPFTDVSDAAFCPFVLEIFYLGITTGTTPTTYDPASPVTRLQMAAFLARSADRTLQRASRRAALDQFWTPQFFGLTSVGDTPNYVRSDGVDVWVSNYNDDSVSRVRAGDGKLLETWTGAATPVGLLLAMGRVFVTGSTAPGRLYQIDPTQAAGAVTTISTNLGAFPNGIAFDGGRIWTANAEGSVTIVSLLSVTTVTTGFGSLVGALYDGANVWVTDFGGKLMKLDTSGAILQTVTLGGNPEYPTFDGTNIWVPNDSTGVVSVVRASTGAVLATLTGNGLATPRAAAFDGQRVLVADQAGSVSLWKAADLTPLGSFPTGASSIPYGACSDGVNFWIALAGTNRLAKF